MTLKANCLAELEELEQRLPELQAEYDAAIEQVEVPLDFYSNEQQD